MAQSDAATDAITVPYADDEHYTIYSAAEISYLLRLAAKKAVPVTAYVDDSNDFALTTVLDSLPAQRQVVLDAVMQEEKMRALLASPQVTCVSRLDGIKIMFRVSDPRRGEYDGRPALYARAPSSLWRLQRREYYRVACPISKPVKCVVSATRDGKAIQAEVVVLDLSCGGIAVMDNHPVIHFEPPKIYRDCRIVLPDTGTVVTGIEVRNTFEVTLKNGLACKRSGCGFVDISQAMVRLIQRYVTRLERERNARF